ncbi:MAG: hypothetical protein H6922_05625 [Pseudomonadaceae bacterium]|nr:hypothetical protein [Pseudomonadaceae bacterium]
MNQPAAKDAKPVFQQRLDNQKAQLDRYGNFAEVVVRTLPEATDIINFARLWEHTLIQADRQSRGYLPGASRDDYTATHADFEACLAFMAERLRAAAARHGIDYAGNGFIARVAQRYGIAGKAATPSAIGAQAAVDSADDI